MKLAEALNLRADVQKRIASLKERLIRNAKVQEGDVPAEDPVVLLKELEGNIIELEKLIKAINKTNSLTYRYNCKKRCFRLKIICFKKFYRYSI